MEQVEQLKDRLNKHMHEIKKLFGVDSFEDEEDVHLLEEEHDAKKLADQISKLREIIEENRRALVGVEEDEEERLFREQAEKERQEQLKQDKEEADRLSREQQFAKLQEVQQNKQQQEIDAKKDEVLGNFEKDMEERKQQLLFKLGGNLTREEQQALMD